MTVAATCVALLSAAPVAAADPEGPGTPQAQAAHAGFLATLPAPPGGAGAVCVIDSGVDTDTDLGPALIGRSAYDGGTPDDTGALSDDGTPLPKHGTYVAGVIASQIDGVGTNGIWPAAKVLSRRVFAGPESGTTAAAYIRAIDWCVEDAGADLKVINLSLSGLSATPNERAALDDKLVQVHSAPYDVNVVAAAGNDASEAVGYPASAPGVLAVGATDASGAFAPFSNRGAGLGIATVGVGVCVTTEGGSGLATANGTSYAAPIVSAVLDALRSYRPDLSADDAEQLLLDNADDRQASKVLDAAQSFQAAGVLPAAQAAQSYPKNGCEAPPAPHAPPVPNAGTAAGAAEAPAPVRLSPSPAPVAAVPTPPSNPASRSTRAPTHGPRRRREDVPHRPAKPVLRSLRYRRNLLTVRIRGLRRGEQAVFRVIRRAAPRHRRHGHGREHMRARSDHTYVRSSPRLRARVTHWLRLSVRLRAPGIGMSKPLIVRHGGRF